MDAGQIFALVWAVLAIIFGAWLLTTRHRIAQITRAEREAKGTSLGTRSQTPLALGISGGLFLGVGLVIGVMIIVTLLR